MMRGNPILRTHPHRVLARDADSDYRGCVGDRSSEAVGEQVRRTHLSFKLRVDDPAPIVIEVLGLNQDSRSAA